MQSPKTLDKIIFSLYVLFAVGFLALYLPFHPYAGSFLIKAVPLASLSTLALVRLRGTTRILLVGGMVFSLVGDVVLDLDRSRFFVIGLAAFLIAHLLYALLFARGARWFRKALPAVLAVGLFAAALAFMLRDMDPGRIVPVMAYLAVISLMTVSATLYFFTRGGRSAGIAWAGAWVFMASDTVIAVNQFLRPIPNSLMYSLTLYWTAQAMIAAGVILRKDGET